MHGRIPVFNCEKETMSKEVILTESDYYKEERINYSWTNTIQSYVLGRANVIFIGFSGTDYNFRRLLKYIRRDRSNAHKRYIFFRSMILLMRYLKAWKKQIAVFQNA